jgi:hypothetical protein
VPVLNSTLMSDIDSQAISPSGTGDDAAPSPLPEESADIVFAAHLAARRRLQCRNPIDRTAKDIRTTPFSRYGTDVLGTPPLL